ncbi:MAG: GerMN domain-containing protein [Clostridiales bacterium]|jgi:hypothetical protein|nr:GerMN domain-containing protein [Clostridiales bacterium]
MNRILFFLLFILLLAGCGSKTVPEENKPAPEDSMPAPENSEIYEYFPFTENTLYQYAGEGHEYAAYQTYNTFINDNRLQRRIATDVKTYDRQTEIFEVSAGELRLINGDTFYYHFENQTADEPQKNMVLLKEPLELGAKWNITETDTAEVTGVDVDVQTPLGNYKALEITSISANGFNQKDYYVKNVGLVKTTYTTTNNETPITSSLSAITEDTHIMCDYNSFFPIPGTGELSFYEDEVEIRSNYDVIGKLNEILSKPSPDGLYGALLGTGSLVEINFATNTSAVRLNFDAEIYEMEFSAEVDEEANLYALALTTGRLLGVEQVFIFVDGKPYSGTFVTKTEDDGYLTKLE